MDSTPVDAGPSGFLNIFGSSAAEPTTPETEPTDSAQAEPTAADSAPPESVDDADLSADELVAARLAATLEADGIALPEPDAEEVETTPEGEESHPLLATPDGEPSLDNLTPEQLRALAEEAIRLRNEVSISSRHEAARKVAAAEAAAVAQVQTEFERNVLAVSEQHYSGVFQERLTRLVAETPEDQLPARVAALADQVYQARTKWETEQADAYEQRAKAAALAARKTVPEVRQLYAAELVRQSGLPEAAVAEVLKVTNTDEFPARVEELVGIRNALLAERNRNQNKRRAEANKNLAATTPRTTATGRPRGGKPPEYRGNAAEGARLLSIMRTGS